MMAEPATWYEKYQDLPKYESRAEDIQRQKDSASGSPLPVSFELAVDFYTAPARQLPPAEVATVSNGTSPVSPSSDVAAANGVSAAAGGPAPATATVPLPAASSKSDGGGFTSSAQNAGFRMYEDYKANKHKNSSSGSGGDGDGHEAQQRRPPQLLLPPKPVASAGAAAADVPGSALAAAAAAASPGAAAAAGADDSPRRTEQPQQPPQRSALQQQPRRDASPGPKRVQFAEPADVSAEKLARLERQVSGLDRQISALHQDLNSKLNQFVADIRASVEPPRGVPPAASSGRRDESQQQQQAPPHVSEATVAAAVRAAMVESTRQLEQTLQAAIDNLRRDLRQVFADATEASRLGSEKREALTASRLDQQQRLLSDTCDALVASQNQANSRLSSSESRSESFFAQQAASLERLVSNLEKKLTPASESTRLSRLLENEHRQKLALQSHVRALEIKLGSLQAATAAAAAAAAGDRPRPVISAADARSRQTTQLICWFAVLLLLFAILWSRYSDMRTVVGRPR